MKGRGGREIVALWAFAGVMLFSSCASPIFARRDAAKGKFFSHSAQRKLERSFWVNASLSDDTRKGYWGVDFPPAPIPSPLQIKNAVHLLAGAYGANRLYLIYNHEYTIDQAESVYRLWKKYAPSTLDLVPTLPLLMYDRDQTPVFTRSELIRLARFFRSMINPEELAIYDVQPNRNMKKWLGILSVVYPHGMIRVGLQPDETLNAPFTCGVQDTWSGVCTGGTNSDWARMPGGEETLRKWVRCRNAQNDPISWDLITVAWDYHSTKDGVYPGYDDANRNMPLPKGRNGLVARLILSVADAKSFAGFSSDLYILEANSLAPTHDGASHSFYSTLRSGKPYRGYYHAPLDEIAKIYRSLAKGAFQW
jgi:hypothetical protein